MAADPDVRAALVAKQRALLAAGDWVAEGRDIGTQVAPDAAVKVFLDRRSRGRARRRAAELGAAGRAGRASRVRCATSAPPRARTAPLRARPRAVEVDTTGLSPLGQVAGSPSGRRSARTRDRPVSLLVAKVAVVGYPNVGKSRWSTASRARARRSSTSAQGHARPQGARLRVERAAVQADRHGRRRLRGRGSARRLDPRPGARRLADAQVAVLVVDARAGVRPGDEEMADLLRRSGADDRCGEQVRPRRACRWPRIPPPRPRRAARRLRRPGPGSGDLLDRIVELLPAGEAARDADVVRLASSAAQRRQVLARQPLPRGGAGDRLGAGRHDARCDRHAAARRRAQADADRHGGLRRQPKVADSVEYYTALRSQRAAERADVALVVCDASDGVTAQDLRVAELAMKAGCATALVLNKWDLPGERTWSTSARVWPRSCACAPACSPLSATTGRNVARPADRGGRARRPHGGADPDAPS